MQLSEATIQELREIVSEDYGKDLTFQKTSEIANLLVGLFNALQRLNKNGNHHDANTEKER